NQIAKMTTSGVITEYTVPGHGLWGIGAGPDGNIWFTEYAANNIGRIAPNGTVSEFPLPTPFAVPQYVTAGPDGNLWFTESGGSKVGKIDPTGSSITEYPLSPGRVP